VCGTAVRSGAHADRLTDPVNELSDHAVPAAVESSVPEAGVVNRPEVVVELDDV